MRITYVPSDMDAPGSYRCLFPGRQLKLRGHTVALPPRKEFKWEDGTTKIALDERGILENPDCDIVVLQQRKERVWAGRAIPSLQSRGVVVVAECDDNYLELPDYNPAKHGTNPYRKSDGSAFTVKERRFAQKNPDLWLKQFPNLNAETRRILKKDLKRGRFPKNKLNRDYMHETFRQADAMSVSTPYLKEIYSKLNSDITVIRNYLDWEMWEDVVPVYEQDWPRVRIGYMGVWKYRRGDLEVVKDVVPEFLNAHPEVDFVANSGEVHEFLGVPSSQRITYPEIGFWQSGGTYDLPTITAVMDVGLVPLTMNGLNEAKSHLKGMEYNACGIPFIASPTESYKDYWCQEGENGFLAKNPEQWRDKLEFLIADADNRRDMGARGRAKAERHSIQRNVHEWEDFYAGLLGDDAQGLAREALRRGAIQKVSELAPLLRILEESKPQVVVEIGSANGGTFHAFCRCAADDALLVSIDLPFGDFSKRDESFRATGKDRYGRTDTPIETMRASLKPGQRGEFLRADSQDAKTREALERILAGRAIDFLFIDGDHSYEGVKRDFELYGDLVDGLAAFHDVLPHPKVPNAKVHELWAEIRDEYKTFEFCDPENDRGWGIWGGIGCVEMERLKLAA